MEINKRGVSDVIATVLIIIVTIAAVAIIAPFIISFVKNNLNSSTECLNYQDYFSFDDSFGYNCISGDQISLTIKTKENVNSSGEISSLEIVMFNKDESKKFSVPSGEVTLLNGNSSVVPKSGETRSYTIETDEIYEKAEVYPKLASGRTCEKTDSVILEACL